MNAPSTSKKTTGLTVSAKAKNAFGMAGSMLAVAVLLSTVVSSTVFAADKAALSDGSTDIAQSPAADSAPKVSAKKAKASKKAKAAKHAKAAKKAKTTAAAVASKGKLSRDVVFDGSVVNGKYLASGEAVSTVENEKSLNNLIGMRGDFKDRLGDQRAQLEQSRRSGATDK